MRTRSRRPRSTALVVLVLLTAAACGTPTPTPPPAVVVPPAERFACNAVPLAECGPFAALAPDLAGVPPAAIRRVEVGPVDCQAQPCPRSLGLGLPVAVLVEYTDGRPAERLSVAPGPPPRLLDRQPWGMALESRSRRVAGVGPHPFTLGHCGLYSGIDFDGSWWDPFGEVDAHANSAINAASGSIRLHGPDRAAFTAADGFRVWLVRRTGPAWLPGCR